MSEQPVTTCPTCGAPVTIQGDTTLHYQPVQPTGLTIEDVQMWCETRVMQLDDEYADLEQRGGDPRSLAELDGQVTAYCDLAEALDEGRLPE